jgi:hypothetical protein
VRGLADDPACTVRRPQLTLPVPSESASPAGPRGVGHPAPILPAQSTTAAHEPVIIFGTYLAQPAAYAHSAPGATACDTISPDRVSAGQVLFLVPAPSAGFDPGQAEPTVQDTAHLQRPGDLRVPVMTCDFSWWQVLGSNQRRLSRRFCRPCTGFVLPAFTP